MAKRGYWQGLATGTAVGAGVATGALLFTNLWGRAGHSRIIRLEKSIQIGSPVEEVFEAWRDLASLAAMSNRVIEVRDTGDDSHWRVRLDGRTVEWDAHIEQLVPNQSIGWKSTSGPKHSGRVTFTRLGTNTLVHVSMNYAPRWRIMRPFLAPMAGNLEGIIEEVLRGVKHSMENGRAPASLPRSPQTVRPSERATGTFGAAPAHTGETSGMPVAARNATPPSPVEFAAPGEAKR